MIIHVSWIVESRGIIYFIVKKNCSWKKKGKKRRKDRHEFTYSHTHTNTVILRIHTYISTTLFLHAIAIFHEQRNSDIIVISKLESCLSTFRV